MSTNKPVVLDATARKMVEVLEGIKDSLDGQDHAVAYGIRIDKNNSDPEARCEYIYDAVGFTPAKMNYTNSAFEYGSWKDTELIQSNFPAMVKSSGELDYKLNPNNYALKEDGTASDVANIDYDGNAESVFKGGWLAHYEDDDYEYIAWSNVKYNDNFHCYHRMYNGIVYDGFCTNMFPLALVDSKGRSISGQTHSSKTTASAERTYNQAIGSSWDTWNWSEYEYIVSLCKIIGKSENLQEVFGQGNTTSGESGVLDGGQLNDKGQFFGYSGTTQAVKVFHIENLWGNLWSRILGLLNVDGVMKVSPYGPYDLTGTNGNYVDVMTTPTTNGYVKDSLSNQYGRFPKTIGGSASTYWCDYFYQNASGTKVALVGGSSGFGSFCGECVRLNYAASYADWAFSARHSSKMSL